MSIEYTEEDWAAWLEENPWDADDRGWIVGTFGFQFFVLDRRTSEVGGALRRKFERFRDSVDQRRAGAIRRYFKS